MRLQQLEQGMLFKLLAVIEDRCESFMKSRSNIIDMMRAIGIILVVLGHCLPASFVFLKRFIYLFHLPLFFLISGYLYNEKSSDKPWEYIGTRLQSYLKAYVMYGSILVFFHNILYRMGIFSPGYIGYNFRDFMTGFFNTFVFLSNEPFSAAMWFIPVLFISLVIFNFIFAFANHFPFSINKEKTRFILIVLFTLLGIYLNVNQIELMWHCQTCFVILPFLYVGNLIRNQKLKWLKANWVLAIIIILFVCLGLYYVEGSVELSQNSLWIPPLFYIGAFAMIYVVYTFCHCLQSQHMIKKCLTVLGKNTLPIMCFHILVFKLMDFVVITLFSKNYPILSSFTVSYPDMFVFYTIFGILGSLILDYIFAKIFIVSKKFVKYCLK